MKDHEAPGTEVGRASGADLAVVPRQGGLDLRAGRRSRAPAVGASLRDDDALVVSADLRNERVLASAAYLAALGGFWLVGPAVAYLVYLWQGRTSRFLAFHAVQSLLLQVVLIPISMAAIGVAAGLYVLLTAVGSTAALAAAVVVVFTVLGLALMVPVAVTVWVGLCALRGQPRALPVLGRWAARVVDD